jgi:hypothetical protein
MHSIRILENGSLDYRMLPTRPLNEAVREKREEGWKRLEMQLTNLRLKWTRVLKMVKNLSTKANSEGEDELKRIPSLRLKKWNATRWLGRAECLETVCRVYRFVLDHLKIEKKGSADKDTQRRAADLYERLTCYDTFLFIHFYRDLTSRMAVTSKQLQKKELQMSSVGKYIRVLSKRLEQDFSRDKEYPDELLGDGITDNVIRQLFALQPEDTLGGIVLLKQYLQD